MSVSRITIQVEHPFGLLDQTVGLAREIENAPQVSIDERRNRIELQRFGRVGAGFLRTSEPGQEIRILNQNCRFIRTELDSSFQLLFSGRKVPLAPPVNLCQRNVRLWQ